MSVTNRSTSWKSGALEKLLAVCAAITILVAVPSAAHALSVRAELTPTGSIPVGRFPLEIALSSDGTQAYVGNVSDGTVSVIDVASRTVTRTITGMGQPWRLAVADDGTVYAAQEQEPAVTVAAPGSDAAGRSLTLPGESGAIGVSPDGDTLWVGLPDLDSVIAIDPVAGTTKATFAIDAPSDIVVDADADVHISTSTGNTVTTIAGGTVTQSAPLTTQQNGLLVVGETAYVSAGSEDGTGTLTQVNLTDGTAGWTAAVGILPVAPAIDANGFLYVPNLLSGDITVISPAGAVVGGESWGLEAGPSSAVVGDDAVFVVLSGQNEVVIYAPWQDDISDPEISPTPSPAASTVTPTPAVAGTGSGALADSGGSASGLAIGGVAFFAIAIGTALVTRRIKGRSAAER